MSTDIDRSAPAEVAPLEDATARRAAYERDRDYIRANRDVLAGVAAALARIRDGDLYLHEYPTFEAFCRAELGVSRQRVQQIEQFVATREALAIPKDGQRTQDGSSSSTSVDENTPDCHDDNLGKIADELAEKATEWTLRPLGKLPPERRREAWVKVVELAGRAMPTKDHFDEVIAAMARGDEAVLRSVDEALAEVTGLPKSRVRDARIVAEGLSEDDRAALREAGVPEDRIRRIAGIRDPRARRAVASRTAFNPDDFPAIWAEEVDGVPTGAYVEDVRGGTPGRPPREEDLDDEAWLRRIAVREKLPNARLLDQEALRWRRMREAIATLQAAARRHQIGERRAQVQGFFTRRLSGLLHVKHPWDWMACGKCGGTGRERLAAGQEVSCSSCGGGGFRD